MKTPELVLGAIYKSSPNLEKHKIENYLSTFIKKGTGQSSMALAVSKWKKDLVFVEKYNINRQAKVKITAIKPYQ